MLYVRRNAIILDDTGVDCNAVILENLLFTWITILFRHIFAENNKRSDYRNSRYTTNVILGSDYRNSSLSSCKERVYFHNISDSTDLIIHIWCLISL